MPITSKKIRSRKALIDAPHLVTMIIQDVPRTTKEAFKRTCIGKETMRNAIVRLMRYYVQVNGEMPGDKRRSELHQPAMQ